MMMSYWSFTLMRFIFKIVFHTHHICGTYRRDYDRSSPVVYFTTSTATPLAVRQYNTLYIIEGIILEIPKKAG